MDNLSNYLLDLVQNSIAANSSMIKLKMVESNLLSVVIEDNGSGMEEEQLKQASSPFYTTRTTRKTGLGLSMVKMLTEQVEGAFELSSTKGSGTKLKLTFNHHHIDMPDMGDLGEMIYMISIHQDVSDFIFDYVCNQQYYHYHLKEIKDVFQSSLHTYGVMKGLIASINKEINNIRGVS